MIKKYISSIQINDLSTDLSRAETRDIAVSKIDGLKVDEISTLLKLLKELCLKEETYLEVGDNPSLDWKRFYIDGCMEITEDQRLLLEKWLGDRVPWKY